MSYRIAKLKNLTILCTNMVDFANLGHINTTLLISQLLVYVLLCSRVRELQEELEETKRSTKVNCTHTLLQHH